MFVINDTLGEKFTVILGRLDPDYCCCEAIQIQSEFSAVDNYLPWPCDKLLALMKGCRRSHESSLIKKVKNRERSAENCLNNIQ